jgi:plastocyanin
MRLTIFAVTAVVLGAAAAPPADGVPRAVRVDDNYFSPRTVTVARGGTVRWRWTGDRQHNVTGSNFASRTQARGAYARRFPRRGNQRIFCTLHAGMEMTVRVR